VAMLSFVWASMWLFERHELLLQYFYMPELLALTHLVTLGFVTSMSMGVLQRLLPTLLSVRPRSRRLAALQLGLFLIGASGLVFHFWIEEWIGMGWATLLVVAAALVQLANLRDVWPLARQGNWTARYVAAALVGLPLAASVGALIGMNKALALETSLLPASFLGALYTHIHLAAVGWVTNLIFGFQLELVPTTVGSPRWLPVRFWMLQGGLLGLAITLLFDRDGAGVFATLVVVAVGWHVWGPTRAFLAGRLRETALVPLWLLLLCALAGWLMATGVVPESHEARPRLQAAYGYVGLYGWFGLTIVAMAFKLFPMWVWKERFQEHFGKRPVPGMQDLYSHRLKAVADFALATGVIAVGGGALFASRDALRVGSFLALIGVLGFLANFVRMARWELLKLEYQPTPADWEKFHQIFPDAATEDRDGPATKNGSHGGSEARRTHGEPPLPFEGRGQGEG